MSSLLSVPDLSKIHIINIPPNHINLLDKTISNFSLINSKNNNTFSSISKSTISKKSFSNNEVSSETIKSFNEIPKNVNDFESTDINHDYYENFYN